MTTLRALWRDTAGATSIEYAMIGCLIAIAIVVSATAVGTKLSAKVAPLSANLN